MAGRALDDSQRSAAKYAALAYLISFVTVVLVNFGIFALLMVRGNSAETARKILAHETLFRIGIVGDLVYCMGVVVLLTALYVILKPVNQNLALLAAFGRLVYAVVWVLVPLNLLSAVRMLSGTEYALRWPFSNWLLASCCCSRDCKIRPLQFPQVQKVLNRLLKPTINSMLWFHPDFRVAEPLQWHYSRACPQIFGESSVDEL